jgi:succinylarginine dihydrolase
VEHRALISGSRLVEINFDGIIGPTHNYAGLSLGNLAAAAHKGQVSNPKAAALQGLAKMRHNLALGLVQGFFMPLPRPNQRFLQAIAADEQTDPALLAAAWSASSMWTANAATVSPAPDTADQRCHFTPANLVTMAHRFQEWQDTARQLTVAFADQGHFVHHRPIMPCFGDEGAANHMRMGERHDAPGLEIFVYGRFGAKFPARQHEQACRIIARQHCLDPERVLFVEQNPEAIGAGAFHNDVVAVANERVLLCHELAFADPEGTYAAIREKLPQAEIIIVPDSEVSLEDAVRSYLFNAQLVTLPEGGMALVVPSEARENASVGRWLDAMLAGNGPIREVLSVDVRQSMANGGGPACLRLRVVADPETIDPRFLLDEAKADAIEAAIRQFYPEAIDPADLGSETLTRKVVQARDQLLHSVDLGQLG